MNTQTNLRSWCLVPDRSPNANIDLAEIQSRNDAARRILAGFANDMPALYEIWRYLVAALDDTVALSAEVTRLTAEVQTTRLDHANLLAAVRATIAAERDGEADPLWYVRDELDALQTRSEATRRPS
jgi:hypothetical protein